MSTCSYIGDMVGLFIPAILMETTNNVFFDLTILGLSHRPNEEKHPLIILQIMYR